VSLAGSPSPLSQTPDPNPRGHNRGPTETYNYAFFELLFFHKMIFFAFFGFAVALPAEISHCLIVQ
jgi:hypothetical protein